MKRDAKADLEMCAITNAQFAREALPYWIKRAMEAEDLLKSIFCSCGVCFAKADCEECNETEKRIKRFLGAEPCDK